MDREFGRRVGLQTLVRDEFTARDRSPIVAFGQSLLGARDCRESRNQRVGDGVVGAFGHEEFRGVAHVTLFIGGRAIGLTVASHGLQQIFHARAFRTQQFSGSIVVHHALRFK